MQAAQVYAASIMFGYFIRRVDKRFQLESQLGLLDDQQADAVARLERLFNSASEDQQDPDRPATPSGTTMSGDSDTTSSSSSGADTKGEGAGLGKGKKKDSLLRKYIESFDQQTLADMTKQVVSCHQQMQTCRLSIIVHGLICQTKTKKTVQADVASVSQGVVLM